MNISLLFLLAPLLLVGAGCVSSTQSAPPLAMRVSAIDAIDMDPYEDWELVTISEVLTLRIPPDCRSASEIKFTAIVCPTETNPTPPPDMYISTDGTEIAIRRWEDLEWDAWDAVIASIQILTPLTNEVQLTIQK